MQFWFIFLGFLSEFGIEFLITKCFILRLAYYVLKQIFHSWLVLSLWEREANKSSC